MVGGFTTKVLAYKQITKLILPKRLHELKVSLQNISILLHIHLYTKIKFSITRKESGCYLVDWLHDLDLIGEFFFIGSFSLILTS